MRRAVGTVMIVLGVVLTAMRRVARGHGAGCRLARVPVVFVLLPLVVGAHLGLVQTPHFDDHPNDVAMRSHAYRQGSAVYQAVRALRAFEVPPYPSTHNLGTNRMSARPADGVCNKWGQAHDIPNLFISDGSQFTTGGAENPTLTIVTLAIRQAAYLAEQLSKRSI